jgi:hypothetical protein
MRTTQLPTHVGGVREGNWPGSARSKQRARGADEVTTGGPHRSTGIDPSRHVPIDPRMPKLTPP